MARNEYQRAYYHKHKDQRKAYYEKNKEKIADRMRAWRQKNREKISETYREWVAANPEKKKSLREKWRLGNPERHAISRARALKNQRCKRVGITPQEYDEIFARQNGRCAICEGIEPRKNGGNWHIDHDHETRVVRGILCHSCNVALGLMKDDPTRFRRAARYLETQK